MGITYLKYLAKYYDFTEQKILSVRVSTYHFLTLKAVYRAY